MTKSGLRIAIGVGLGIAALGLTGLTLLDTANKPAQGGAILRADACAAVRTAVPSLVSGKCRVPVQRRSDDWVWLQGELIVPREQILVLLPD